jgi:hypothetical protein
MIGRGTPGPGAYDSGKENRGRGGDCGWEYCVFEGLEEAVAWPHQPLTRPRLLQPIPAAHLKILPDHRAPKTLETKPFLKHRPRLLQNPVGKIPHLRPFRLEQAPIRHHQQKLKPLALPVLPEALPVGLHELRVSDGLCGEEDGAE